VCHLAEAAKRKRKNIFNYNTKQANKKASDIQILKPPIKFVKQCFYLKFFK